MSANRLVEISSSKVLSPEKEKETLQRGSIYLPDQTLYTPIPPSIQQPQWPNQQVHEKLTESGICGEGEWKNGKEECGLMGEYRCLMNEIMNWTWIKGNRSPFLGTSFFSTHLPRWIIEEGNHLQKFHPSHDSTPASISPFPVRGMPETRTLFLRARLAWTTPFCLPLQRFLSFSLK